MRLFLPCLVAGFVVASCGGGNSPSPSPSPVPQPPAPATPWAGTWNGPARDSSGPGTLTFVLTQSGGDVTGTARVADASGITGNGRFDGLVLADGTLNISIVLPAGSFPSPFQRCSVSTGAIGRLSNSNRTMSLTYGGTNSCTGRFTNGTATLQKQ